MEQDVSILRFGAQKYSCINERLKTSEKHPKVKRKTKTLFATKQGSNRCNWTIDACHPFFTRYNVLPSGWRYQVIHILRWISGHGMTGSCVCPHPLLRPQWVTSTFMLSQLTTHTAWWSTRRLATQWRWDLVVRSCVPIVPNLSTRWSVLVGVRSIPHLEQWRSVRKTRVYLVKEVVRP